MLWSANCREPCRRSDIAVHLGDRHQDVDLKDQWSTFGGRDPPRGGSQTAFREPAYGRGLERVVTLVTPHSPDAGLRLLVQQGELCPGFAAWCGRSARVGRRRSFGAWNEQWFLLAELLRCSRCHHLALDLAEFDELSAVFFGLSRQCSTWNTVLTASRMFHVEHATALIRELECSTWNKRREVGQRYERPDRPVTGAGASSAEAWGPSEATVTRERLGAPEKARPRAVRKVRRGNAWKQGRVNRPAKREDLPPGCE